MNGLFDSLAAMNSGNNMQRQAVAAVKRLGILIDFSKYDPIVCGTIPLQIDLEESDLDIIFYVNNFDDFEQKVLKLYGHLSDFRLERKMIRNEDVVKANFNFEGFEFEIFGQNLPTHKQHAYLHMVIQAEILKREESLKQQIIGLKEEGYKTEPAFCEVLGISGDPYIGLLEYGKKYGFIK
ncbi:DUF4269 domain-containing protein [Alkalibacillus haloalkaliphilus]|uniref:DUF4269 domain-containing protein n=1 Tax=Alkalibacillus haloalkaliphilus TaxID=94136 RepID=UPI002935F097|nr:DUF4269 domain-containing protein [Alkalibacillus haloalkaliphilus]MDV2583052.1 DUF4269 domain-containing protein [Alkalibacillus haloalkaliphilus]